MRKSEKPNVVGKLLGFVCHFCFALLAISAVVATSARMAIGAPTVVTDQGPVVGISKPGEKEFLGIPYAAPPVGTLRWLPPKSSAPFNGLFQATQFGNVCPQSLNGANTDFFGNEDCLYLNVYVPSDKPPHNGFPVMVWIHGGGLTFGAGSFYDPSALVKNGKVIVVTINYRLGLLGFFANPAIDAEGHTNGNYGLMDQQFALAWVGRNIKAFGGNPRRVTIFGESAGGFSVFSNLASPTAAGLFQGAISESGGYYHFQDYFDAGGSLASVVPLATAETVGTIFVPAGTTLAANAGCPSSLGSGCLRAANLYDLVGVIKPGAVVFPIIDGTVLTQTLDSAFASGAFNHVPVISGTNHDEARLFVAEDYDFGVGALTDAEYPFAVAAYIGQPISDAFIQDLINVEYPLTNYPPPPPYTVSAPLALGALWTDVEFVCTTRNAEELLSKMVPTYVYEFNDETAPPWFNASGLSFPLGDAHFIEVQYLFLNQGFGLSGDQKHLSNTMIGYWTRFAKTGNPNSAGAPAWPLYNSGSLESLLAPTPTTETDASYDADHKCSTFWNTF